MSYCYDFEWQTSRAADLEIQISLPQNQSFQREIFGKFLKLPGMTGENCDLGRDGVWRHCFKLQDSNNQNPLR